MSSRGGVEFEGVLSVLRLIFGWITVSWRPSGSRLG